MKSKRLMLVVLSILLVGIMLMFVLRNLKIFLEPERPSIPPVVEPVMEQRWSVISLPLRASRSELEKFLKKESLKWEYAEKNHSIEVPYGDAWGDLHVTLEGEPSLELSRGLITLEIPLRFKAGVHWEGDLFGLRPSLKEDLDGAVLARVFLRPRFTAEWQLQTHARIEFQWIREPELLFLGHRLALSRWIDPLLNDWLQVNTRRIDEAINEELQLRKRAEREWQKLARPLSLRREPDLWLSIRPLAVHIPKPDIDENGFEARIMIPMNLRLVSGSIPEALSLGPLPSLELGAPQVDGLNLAVPVLLRYGDLEEEARRHLSGYPISLGERGELEVRDIAIRGGGGEILVSLDLKGSKGGVRLEGTVFLRGRPRFDSATSNVYIEDLRFDVMTRNYLSEVASWLLEPIFLERWAKGLMFPIKDLINEVKRDLQKDFRYRRVDENLVLRGSIIDLKLTQIYPASQGLLLEVAASGRAGLNFEQE